MSTIEDDLDQRLSARLRAEREQRGWSLADLAERSGVSRAMISKVERGESSPTATLLGRLSGAFGVTLSQLLARAEAGGGRLSRRADQSTWTDPETGFHRRALTPQGEAAAVELVWGELPPGAEIGYPAAAYAFIDDEQVVVIDGALELRQGAATYRLEAGDCLRFGPPEETVFRNPGRKTCTYLLSVLRTR